MTQRTRIFFYNYFFYLRFFWIWLNFFFYRMTFRTELFFSNVTQKNWTFFFRMLLEELNTFYIDSKNWTFFPNKTPRIEPFNNTTQWFCSLNMTQFFFEYDSTNWIFFSMTPKHSIFVFKMTEIIEPFSIWL